MHQTTTALLLCVHTVGVSGAETNHFTLKTARSTVYGAVAGSGR